MSKIGKKPIVIPDGISVVKNGDILEFKKGDSVMTLKILPFIGAEISEETIEDKTSKIITFKVENDSNQATANWGTTRSLANNIIIGFSKVLEIEGVGYRAMMEGDTLVLNLGFSHPVRYNAVKGVKISTEKNAITIAGQDKEAVGQTAAEIRALKKPEPYKGKGIKYRGEIIRRKQGKKVGSAAK
jgi:large subunit ribosomal protein L6